MSKNHRRLFWPGLLIVGIAVGAIALASARKDRESRLSTERPMVVHFQDPVANSESNAYVHSGALWPQLRWNLKALGDRLEKPGKERLVVTGTLDQDAQSRTYTAIMEFPDRLNLTIQNGLETRTVTFDGNRANALGAPLSAAERDLIETLVYDTPEHFFGGQARGTATRFLGDHFRLDDGAQANYTGPFYDVYQTTEQIRHTVPPRQQTKLYCFNSDTHLLERISYELERNGFRTAVEIRISGWQKMQGQQVPTRIVRLENNRPALTLTITSVALNTKVDDGAFGK